MKIFLTGGSGQAGYELRRSLMLYGDVMAPTRQELDLADAAAVKSWLDRHRPDCLVNAAAYTAVDKAEGDAEQAFRLNAALPALLADYAARHGARLVQYSTDYVYDGSGQSPRDESAPMAPCNIYGQSKMEGDMAVMRSGASYLIFRTSWVYAARGHNFLRTMLRLAQQRDSLSVVADQMGAPTTARLLAEVTSVALTRALASGTYHVACRGETSWHGFACHILQEAAAMGWPLRATPASVQPITTDAYGAPAPRPRNSRLAVDRIETALNLRLPHWTTALTLTLQELYTCDAPQAKRETVCTKPF